MRTLIAALVLATLGGVTIIARQQRSRELPAPDVDAQLTDELRGVENDFANAILHTDAAALARLVAPEFTLRISGVPQGSLPRAVWMDNTLTRLKPESYQMRHAFARKLAGDLAAVSAVLTYSGTMESRDFSGVAYLVDLWRQKDRQWRIVARYSSAIGAPPERANRSIPPPADVDPELTSTLRRLEEQIDELILHGFSDTDAFKRLVGSDFALRVSEDPERTSSRTAWATSVGAGVGVEGRHHAARRLSDDLAVVSELLTGKAGGASPRSDEFYVVDIWQKRSAGWQLIARYSCRIEPAVAVTG